MHVTANLSWSVWLLQEILPSEIVARIQRLTIRGVSFELSSEAERAREILFEKLCSYPILRYFDVTRPAVLYTDANGFSIGAILGQVEEDGKEYVCEFFGRALRKHERNYSVAKPSCFP